MPHRLAVERVQSAAKLQGGAVGLGVLKREYDYDAADEVLLVEDYDEAAALVESAPNVEWADRDPGPPEGPDLTSAARVIETQGEPDRDEADEGEGGADEEDAADETDAEGDDRSESYAAIDGDQPDPPFDPGEFTIEELRERLDDDPPDQGEALALYSAEADGKDRVGAKDAIDAHL